MALNFTVSYSFSPNTTISSSQVNTNTSDVANVFTGVEALTKTWAKLKVDVDPTTALEVATKQYVDHYSTWRRPSLVWVSITTVDVETGINGTSGSVPMLFGDGTMRTETSTTRYRFDITRNCALSGTAQSGLRATLSEAINTRYHLYAVQVSDSSTTWVTVGDTLAPTQANYASINTNFGGAGKWVYLGAIYNGNGLASSSDIVSFVQSGAMTVFNNSIAAGVNTWSGVLLTVGTAATLTYTYSTGTGVATFPTNIKIALFGLRWAPVATGVIASDAAAAFFLHKATSSASQDHTVNIWMDPTIGVKLSNNPASSIGYDILLGGFIDNALANGSNPLL